MARSDKDPLKLVGGLDPALRDAPPAPGSPRYDAILESAMTQTTTTPITMTEPRRPKPMRRRAFVGAAALAAAVAVVAVVVPMSHKSPAASGIVLTAAEQLSDSTTVRGHATFDHPGDPTATADIEWDGKSSRIVFHETDGIRVVTTIGGTVYEEFGGKINTVKATAANSLAAYPKSARDVVRAVVTNNDVQQVKDNHYRLTMTDSTRQALGAVATGELAWFDLDSPQDVTSVDIWISGDRLDRLTMTGSFGSSDMRYTDFGAPITITAPRKN
jgi:hypothetical protein